ncbi:hypothetical protein LQZ21_03990 [Treponema sp. TIM-1]|uniref:beta strand repeat-containing protein n=1 Tax=Treponema sp. TIM-1 TaxID=2898417 RepID=UPI0039815B24
MLKKYIFGSVVLLLAALFVLTGCSQATDSDGGTVVYSQNYLFGEADAADVAAAVRSALDTKRAVILTDSVILTGGVGYLPARPPVASFGTVDVRVEGDVTVTAGIIVNAALANLTFEEGATITVQDTGVFIYRDADDGNHIITASDAVLTNQGRKVRYMENALMAVQGTDAHIAIPSYQIGSAFTADVAPHVQSIYVVDKLTINAGSTAVPGNGTVAGTPQFIALGEVDLTGSNGAVFAAIGTNFKFADTSTLTSSVPESVTLILPASPSAYFGTIKATTPITIAGPDSGGTTLINIGNIEGPETLTISDATSIATLSIGGVAESGKVAVSTGTIGTAVSIGNSAGSISVVVSTISGTVGIGTVSNAGTIAITAANLSGVVTIANNAGTIAITAPTTFSGAVNATSNEGTLTLNTGDSGSITGGGMIANNSGTINFATTAITTNAFDITTNTSTGVINFTKDFTPTVANFIKSKANNGTINFAASLTTSTALGSAAAANSIAGRGKVIFSAQTTFGAATIIDCETEFKAGLTKNTAGTLTLGGDFVTLDHGQIITLAAVTDKLILRPGTQIRVGETPVLAAGSGEVYITPAAGARLTAGPARTSETDPESVEDRTLILGNAEITDIDGDLRVLPDGYLRLAVANAITVNADTTPGTLTLEDGAFIELGFHASAGNGYKIIIGATQIAGIDGTASFLTATGGPITLAPNRISGSGTLAIPEESGSPTITVTSGTLTIAEANLNLQYHGSLNLAAAGDRIILEGGQVPGKITLGEETEYTVTTLNGKNIGTAAITGSGILRGSAETGSSTVGDLSGATPAGSLTITGPTSGTGIAASASVTL